MNLELTMEEWQTVVNGLAELPAKMSFNLLAKIVKAQQDYVALQDKMVAAHQSGLRDAADFEAERPCQ